MCIHVCVCLITFFRRDQSEISHIISYHAQGDVLNNLAVFSNSLGEDMAVSMLSQGYEHL